MIQFIRKRYNTLIAAAFVVVAIFHAVVAFAEFAFGMTDKSVERLVAIIGVPMVLCLILLWILIFSSRLRDEYSDKLWQKTIRSFALLLLTTPWIWMLGWTIKALFLRNANWLPTDPAAPILPTWGDHPTYAAALQMSGVSFVLGTLWTFAPMVFAALYLWHMWRDRA